MAGFEGAYRDHNRMGYERRVARKEQKRQQQLRRRDLRVHLHMLKRNRGDVAKEQHQDRPRAREDEGRAHRTDARREERGPHRSHARRESRGRHRERSPLEREGRRRSSRDDHRATMRELEETLARMRLQEKITRQDLLDQKREEDKKRRDFEKEMRQRQARTDQDRGDIISQMKEAIEEVLKKCSVSPMPKRK